MKQNMFVTWLFAALDATMRLEMDGEVVDLIAIGEFNLPVKEQVEFEDQLIEISLDGNAEVIQCFKTTPVPPDTCIGKTLCFPLIVLSLVEEFDTSGF